MNIEKSLDATQFVHRLLVSVCLTLFVFIISAESVQSPYVSAQAQYAVLKTTQDSAKRYLEGALARRSQAGAIRRVFRDVFGDRASAVEVRIGSAVDVGPSSTGDASLDSLYRFYESRSWSGQVVPVTHLTDLPELKRAAEKFAIAHPDLTQLREIDVQLNAGVLGRPATARVMVLFRTKLLPKQKLPLTRGSPFNVAAVDSVPMDSVTPFFERAGLIKGAAGSEEAITLASLLPIWHEIDRMTAREASSFLRMQADKARREAATELSLMGFKVRPRLLVVAGPWLALFFLVYLLSHLRHLNVMREGQEETLRCYPWMGVHTNRLGALIIYSSVTLMPLGAVGLTYWRAWDTPDLKLWAAIVSMSCLAAAGACVVRQLWLLNAHVQKTYPAKTLLRRKVILLDEANRIASVPSRN